MSEYLLVSDRCTCEDYPCCGHSRGGETYPMERSMALRLQKMGKVNVYGATDEPVFIGAHIVFEP